MKCYMAGLLLQTDGRTPQGVRGLKYVVTVVTVVTQGSHPARGAWIEIMPRRSSSTAPRVAPRKGCVD